MNKPIDLLVLVQEVAGIGYRASCTSPLAASADGATREESLAKLRADLVKRVAGGDIVRMTIPTIVSREPVWPDDDITRDWLEGMAAARAAEDQQSAPSDVPS